MTVRRLRYCVLSPVFSSLNTKYEHEYKESWELCFFSQGQKAIAGLFFQTALVEGKHQLGLYWKI